MPGQTTETELHHHKDKRKQQSHKTTKCHTIPHQPRNTILIYEETKTELTTLPYTSTMRTIMAQQLENNTTDNGQPSTTRK
jgi:hypothetical protein